MFTQNLAQGATVVDTSGSTPVPVHSDPRHAVCPCWFAPGASGEYWRVDDELFYYGRGVLIIFRDGVLQTAYPASRRHVENVLVSRLERLGWRALFRATRVGRRQVMTYFGEMHRDRGRAALALGCS